MAGTSFFQDPAQAMKEALQAGYSTFTGGENPYPDTPKTNNNQDSQQPQSALQSGYNEGNNATGGLSLDRVRDLMKKKGIVLSPDEETNLQLNKANALANTQAQMQTGLYGLGTAVSNNIANANTQRTMALKAQENAATNTANQLTQLGNARVANANMIQNALTATAGQFR